MNKGKDKGYLVFSCTHPIDIGSKVSIIKDKNPAEVHRKVTLVDAKLNCQEAEVRKACTGATSVIIVRQIEHGSQYRHVAVSMDRIQKATKEIESGILNRSKE